MPDIKVSGMGSDSSPSLDDLLMTVDIGSGANKNITLAALAAAIKSSILASGVIEAFAGTTAPSGWLFCYGQAVSRTTYADLFAAISTTYGTGDGSTTFNLPDLRGRVIAGQDDMGGTSANRLTGLSGGVNGDNLGAAGGAESHTLTASEMPSHRHTLDIKFGSGSGSVYGGLDRLGDSNNTRYTDYVGGGGAHNNVQPTLILNYIIKT